MPYWAVTSKETEALRKVSKRFFVEAKKSLAELRKKQAHELEEFGRHLASEFRSDLIERAHDEETIVADLEDAEEILIAFGITEDSSWSNHFDLLSEELDTHAEDVDAALEHIIEDICSDEGDE